MASSVRSSWSGVAVNTWVNSWARVNSSSSGSAIASTVLIDIWKPEPSLSTGFTNASVLGDLAVGFESAEQHQVAELSVGSDRRHAAPRGQDRVVVGSEAQLTEFAVHDGVGGGEHELFVATLQRLLRTSRRRIA